MKYSRQEFERYQGTEHDPEKENIIAQQHRCSMNNKRVHFDFVHKHLTST